MPGAPLTPALAQGPPPERQCRAIARGKRGSTPEQCQQWTRRGEEFCRSHAPDATRQIGIPPEERRCTATTRRSKERCRLWALQGLTVCYRHGATKRAQAKGRRAVADAKLDEQLNRLLVGTGAAPVDNPLRALASLAGEMTALKDGLAGLVRKLDVDEIRYKGGAGEQIRAEVVLYERALERTGQLLVNIARLNIDDRLAAIEEKQTDTVIRAIEAALASVGVRGEDAIQAKQVAARHLRSVV
ncbi:hypothetical protein [Streptomyces sp. NPDC059928]|uniref:hypothetical protein n=1 Tax=unclassified Streptomyces TaxID=2593676 RepID=UPI00364ACED0